MTTSDDELVRQFLDTWQLDEPGYRAKVVERMGQIRREHPDGDYPGRLHDFEEIGLCVECDALSVLAR